MTSILKIFLRKVGTLVTKGETAGLLINEDIVNIAMNQPPAVVVDALPYIDTGYNEADREMATNLIEEECKRYRPTRNYLDHLPTPNYDAFETEIMKNEYERIQNRQPMELLDMKRYELPGPPSGKMTDMSAWMDSINNAQAQLEHQLLRLCNLELLSDYGTESWKTYNAVLERLVEQYQRKLVDVRKEVQHINMERKTQQTQAGEQLKSLEEMWVGLVTKNYEIERAVLDLEKELQPLRKKFGQTPKS